MIKIGGASAMWGDSLFSVNQLLKVEGINYIMLEGLAEVTMAVMTRIWEKNPELGYAVDFVDPIIKNNLNKIKEKGVKIITNGGGVNPIAAAKHLSKICEDKGISLKIVAVTGDDLMRNLDDYKAKGLLDLTYQKEIPSSNVMSMNAYLGAFPIAQALDMGADVVITGRCVDSALALGPMIHEFGWKPNDFDLLAQGSLAGHLLECGAQSTGGLMTDWDSYDSWANMGYPVIECEANGDFVITKPVGTGGVVNKSSVAEQLLYEIDDPKVYILPDVVCNFSEVNLEVVGENKVKVTNAKGTPPTPTYKAIAQHAEGYRCTYIFMLVGRDLEAKAKRLTDNLKSRFEFIFKTLGYDNFTQFDYELIGTESNFGENRKIVTNREIVLKIAIHHSKKEAINIFSRELPSIAVSTVQSICSAITGRQDAKPFIRPLSYLVDKKQIDDNIKLHFEGRQFDFKAPANLNFVPTTRSKGDTVAFGYDSSEDMVEVPLISLAYGRSGDKGNSSNIGIVGRNKEFYEYLGHVLTADVVKNYFSHFVKGDVYRYTLPGIYAYNFLLLDSLAGGGTASLRFDAQGKGLGQNLLEIMIKVPSRFTNQAEFKKFN